MKLGYWVIGLLGYWVIFASTANAASLSLGVDPPIILINAIPPTAVTSPLNIQNKSDIQVTLQIQLKLFKTKGENGELDYSQEGLEIPKTTIEEFSSNIFFEKGPVPFTVRVRNTGAHFIKPKSEIAIKNMFGQK